MYKVFLLSALSFAVGILISELRNPPQRLSPRRLALLRIFELQHELVKLSVLLARVLQLNTSVVQEAEDWLLENTPGSKIEKLSNRGINNAIKEGSRHSDLLNRLLKKMRDAGR